MILTERMKHIIRILATSPPSRPLTTAMISEELGLSRRTVMREMPDIERWLEENGYAFTKKPGVGLLLKETEERRSLLAQQMAPGKERQSLSREDRQKRILRDLFLAQDAQKAYSFTSTYQISEGTLAADLDRLSAWLSSYHITLSRRPGLGIFLEGTEDALRHAMVGYICEMEDAKALMDVLHNEKQQLPAYLQGLRFAERAALFRKLILDAEAQLHSRFSDRGVLALCLYSALATERVRAGKTLSFPPEQLIRLQSLPTYPVAQNLAQQLFQEANLPLSPDEIGFLAANLSGAGVYSRPQRDLTENHEIQLRECVLLMTQRVEESLQLKINDTSTLVSDLCNHIEPAIHRLRLHIPVENPQTDFIKEEYPHIYQAVEKASAVLCRQFDLPPLPPSEVAFLVAHYGAAIEKEQLAVQKISVAVACPAGIGTSRLLSANLTRAFPNLVIKGQISALRIDQEWLKKHHIDLVVSTMDLTEEICCKYLKVNPSLTRQDKMLLDVTIDHIAQQKSKQSTQQEPKPITNRGRQEIENIHLLTREMLELLDHLTLHTGPIVHNRQELIAQAALTFANETETASALEAAFLRREQLGDTYVRNFHSLLLHCRTTHVSHCRLGYLRLNPPFYEKGHVVMGAVIMLMPEDEHSNTIYAPFMSEISGMLLESKQILSAMHQGDEATFRSELEKQLYHIGQNLMKQYLS